MKQVIKNLIKKLGYRIVRNENIKYDIDYAPEFISEFEALEPNTATSIERIYALKEAVKYIVHNNISGDFVECGVWKGGSCMMIANTLIQSSQKNRLLWLYDTFDGMTVPTNEDVVKETGVRGKDLLRDVEKNTDKYNMWAYAPEELVRNNMKSTSYPSEYTKYIKGKVEETLIATKPESIALLRLDTDWYESTRVEMKELYPLITKGGILIIDDYGYFEGAKKAVDDYFKSIDEQPLMHRIDYTGRMIIKKS
jgi:O-methyltransferase